MANNPLRYFDPTGHRECDSAKSGSECTGEEASEEELRDALGEYGWTAVGQWMYDDLKLLLEVAVDIQLFVDSITDGNGKVWMNEFLSGVQFVHGDILGHDYVLGNVIHLGDNDFKIPKYKLNIAHELGHVWDNQSKQEGGCLATFCGGGIGDQLVEFAGGKPQGLRFVNGSSGIPDDYQYSKEARGGYGNHSTADYLAESFAYTLYNRRDDLPNDRVGVFIMTHIALQTSLTK